jgi:glycosyltransferase involved in cell wall biosynthesis
MEEDLKVLLFSQHLAVGGLERLVLRHAIQLRERGAIEPIVFAYDHSDTEDALIREFTEARIPVLHFPKGAGFSIRTVLRLMCVCLRGRIRVIHTHDLGPLVYATLARILMFGYLRVVHTQHSELGLSQVKRYLRYHRWFTPFASRITAVSSHIKKDYEALGFQSIEVIPNGIRSYHAPRNREERMALRRILAAAQPELKLPTQEHWAICLGRVSPGKGQELAIDLWQRLTDRSGWRFLIVGPEQSPGYIAALRAKAPADVLFLGPTGAPEQWLAASDLYVSASLSEGMPLAPIEALAANVPILLSRIPGHAFLADYASYFPVNQTEEALASWRASLKRAESKDIPLTSERILGLYGIDAMTARYEQIYRNLL